jgi:hypothetical protein
MSSVSSPATTNLVDPVSRIELVPSSSASLPAQTTKTPGVRRRASIREIIFQKIPEKLFKKSNQSEIFLSSSTTIPPPEQKPSPDIDMKRSRPMAITASKETVVPPNNPSPTGRLNWAPEFSPVSFSPTLSVAITPLSPPSSPPPSRSQNLSSFRRRISLRGIPTPLQPIISSRPVSKSSVTQNFPKTHERRRSKYLNDPTVLSMLDRNFEEALELGFSSPPLTPQNRSPSPNAEAKRSPITPSVDGTTVVDTIQEEDEEDIFSRPTPDLALPTLKELDDGEWKDGQGNIMTLRLTLTPATCLTEVEEDFPVESSGGLAKRMSGLGRILGRTRSRKVRI